MSAPMMEQSNFSSNSSQMGLEVPLMEQPKQSAWQARRKRKIEKRRKEKEELQQQRYLQQQQQQENKNNHSQPFTSSPPSFKTKQSPDTPETVPDDELDDPYESDPGESYRDHCERMEAESFPRTKSCLPIPKFLNNPKHKRKSKLEQMRKNSPLFEEEMDHADNLNPLSLPKDLQHLKYSEQSEIGDGSVPQDWEETSRPLRPNRTHINVSHWSDFGKRGYMEDR